MSRRPFYDKLSITNTSRIPAVHVTAAAAAWGGGMSARCTAALLLLMMMMWNNTLATCLAY